MSVWSSDDQAVIHPGKNWSSYSKQLGDVECDLSRTVQGWSWPRRSAWPRLITAWRSLTPGHGNYAVHDTTMTTPYWPLRRLHHTHTVTGAAIYCVNAVTIQLGNADVYVADIRCKARSWRSRDSYLIPRDRFPLIPGTKSSYPLATPLPSRLYLWKSSAI